MDSIPFLECWAVSLLLYILRWVSSLVPGLKVMLGNFLYTPLGWGNVFLAMIYSKCMVLGFLASSIPVIVCQTLHLECLWTLLPVLYVWWHCQAGSPGALRSLRSCWDENLLKNGWNLESEVRLSRWLGLLCFIHTAGRNLLLHQNNWVSKLWKHMEGGGRDLKSWVWKGQVEHGCHQVNRQSCANENGEASWPRSVVGQWKYSLFCLLCWWVNIIIPCFKPSAWILMGTMEFGHWYAIVGSLVNILLWQ